MQLQPMGERLHGLKIVHQDIHLYEAINTFLEKNLEGQTMTLITYGLFADFYKESHKACSLPPLPINPTFIY